MTETPKYYIPVRKMKHRVKRIVNCSANKIAKWEKAKYLEWEKASMIMIIIH